MWNMFSRIRFNRSFVFAAVAILNAALLLTLAPAARADDVVPDATLGGMETVLYSFGVGPTGSVCTNAVDGADPKGSLTYVSATGLLFGRTSTTTSDGDGTVFQIDPTGTGYAVDQFFTGAKTDGTGYLLLKNFDKTQKNNGGDQPHSCFAAAGTVLYGMTSEGGKKGGTTGDGVIFSYDTSTGTYTALFSFDGKDGSDPHGQPIVDPNGTTLYGMTRTGGKADVGVIYSFDTKKKKYKVLH